MKEIFEQYGGPIITVIAIVGLALVIGFVIGTDESGTIGTAFKNLIDDFFTKVTIPGTTVVPNIPKLW